MILVALLSTELIMKICSMNGNALLTRLTNRSIISRSLLTELRLMKPRGDLMQHLKAGIYRR